MQHDTGTFSTDPVFLQRYADRKKTTLAKDDNEDHQCGQCHITLLKGEWHRLIGWEDMHDGHLYHILKKAIWSCDQCYEDWKDFLEATQETGMEYGNLRNRVRGAVQALRLDKDHPLAEKYTLRLIRYKKRARKAQIKLF